MRSPSSHAIAARYVRRQDSIPGNADPDCPQPKDYAVRSSNLVEEFRCSLAYATLGSFAAKLPDRTLGLLARMGHVTQAMGYAGLIPDSQQQSAAYRTIRQALTDDGTNEEAAEAARLARQTGV